MSRALGRPRKHPPPSPSGFGSISPDEVMPLREAARRLGFGAKTTAKAQRDGLRTLEFGRMKYVRGRDVVAWFDWLVEQQADGREGEP
jgi:hypothetical protein